MFDALPVEPLRLLAHDVGASVIYLFILTVQVRVFPDFIFGQKGKKGSELLSRDDTLSGAFSGMGDGAPG